MSPAQRPPLPPFTSVEAAAEKVPLYRAILRLPCSSRNAMSLSAISS